ncbi:MAG: serine hydrolase [Flavobacteriales bacterium]
MLDFLHPSLRATIASLALLPLSHALHAQKQPDLKKLDAYIAKAVTDFGQPGLAVGIVQGGKLIWSHGYGRLDVAKPDPVTENSDFYCASLSKAFTVCAIGMLVDDGVLKWDDKVIEHLPWFKLNDPYVTANMTVRDLLCHRAGFITFDGDLLWYGTHYTPREILDRHAKEPLTYGFRSRFGYSNLMLIAAAALIEKKSDVTWDQFITKRILEPLAMTRTRVETADLAKMTDVALPHVHKGQDPKAPLMSMAYQPLQGADGACGIISCVTDLAKWDAMWMNEGKTADGKVFLKEGTWTTITTDQLSNEVAPEENITGKHYDGTAMGWFTEDRDGYKIITHSGGMPGFILNHAVVPEKDFAVICLGNGETYSVFAITDKILNLYLGNGMADPVADMLPRIEQRDLRDAKRVGDRAAARITGTSPSRPLVQYTGTYTDKIYGDAVITETGGGLSLSFVPAPELFTGTLSHWHYDTFQWNHADPFLEPGYITFSFDADHRITGFKVDLHSPDFHFYKLDFKKKP